MQFLRLMGCNLSCSWCDTPYTWDGSRFDLRAEAELLTADEILERLRPWLPLVVSGGEPLLHQDREVFRQLLQAVVLAKGSDIHIETNGTIAPNSAVVDSTALFVVSPKLSHAGKHRGRQSARVAEGWPELASYGRAILKVVVRSGYETDYVADYAERAGWPASSVWVMPLGTDTATLLEKWAEIATAAAQAGINATQRLHVLAWGDTKGT